MMRFEKPVLQLTVLLGSLVPIGAGGAGILFGPGMMGGGVSAGIDMDSHVRYLSGLLLAIGLGYATTIPHLERHGDRFRLLTTAVVIGGLGRLVSLLAVGVPSPAMQAALVMELVVAPALALWQRRIAADAGMIRHQPAAPVRLSGDGHRTPAA